MTGHREEHIRAGLLVGAVIAWVASAALTVGVYTKTLEVLRGWGLLNQMLLALAITFTVIWAQYRIRRILTDVFGAGIKVQQELDAERRKEEARR